MKPYQQQATASSSHLPTMESLALPEELFWDGKSEPISPPCSELFAIATDLVEPENWLYDDDLANDILLHLEPKPCEEILHDLVESNELVVELCDFKDENWPPQTAEFITQFPTYNEYDNIVTAQPNSPAKIISTPYDVTFDENGLGSSTLTTLTPPQSPPRNGILSILQQQQQLQPQENVPLQLHTIHYRPATSSTTTVQIPTTSAATAPIETYIISNQNTDLLPMEIATPQFSNNANIEVKNELDHEKLVDEIIQEFARDLPDMSDDYESQYTNSPPSQIDESTTDEEWTPSNSASSSPARYSSGSSTIGDEKYQNDLEKSSTVTTGKKRRPYGRGVEDRKIRKKEQNKNAATRYRQKKKLEMEQVLTEEQELTQLNEQLQSKFNKALREEKYLKSLIREFYRNQAKGSASA